jgi:hypothetical protein
MRYVLEKFMPIDLVAICLAIFMLLGPLATPYYTLAH